MDIKKLNERQFTKVLDRQGITVYDTDNDCDRKVMFLKQTAKNTQERIKISYPQEYPWKKGTIIEYKGMYFLITSMEAFESDVYHTSTAIKCNVVWNINGKMHYLVAGELGSANPRHGTIISSVSGSISLFTKKSDVLKINDYVIDFAGTYRCINRFDIDGLSYYFFERTTDFSNELELVCNTAQRTFNLSSDVVNLSCGLQLSSGTANCYYLSDEVTYTYESSVASVGVIDSEGYFAPVGEGTTTITCTATIDDIIMSVTFDVEVVAAEAEVVTVTVTCDTGSTSMLLGYSRSFTAEYLKDGAVDTLMVPEWTVDFYDSDESEVELSGTDYSVTSNGNNVTVSVEDTDNTVALISGKMVVTATYEDGSSGSTSILIRG